MEVLALYEGEFSVHVKVNSCRKVNRLFISIKKAASSGNEAAISMHG